MIVVRIRIRVSVRVWISNHPFFCIWVVLVTAESVEQTQNRPIHAAGVHLTPHGRVEERLLEQEAETRERLGSIDDRRQCGH